MAAKRIGFIGLGAMGRGLAGNLLRKGFDLTVWDVAQPAIDGRHHLGNVFFQACIDLFGRIVGKIPERNPARVDMRLRDLGGFGNNNMSVDVDGRR